MLNTWINCVLVLMRDKNFESLLFIFLHFVVVFVGVLIALMESTSMSELCKRGENVELT